MSQHKLPGFNQKPETGNQKPIICLGMEFESDESRREYFTEELRKKLQDPKFRAIEGFPIGEDEDILALSDPPYYTACPNPWIKDFIVEWENQKPETRNQEPYHREPSAADVKEGKNDPIYNAHSYHTKVPHKAIMRYILHYTEPGDIVFDGFCGTGMTGAAAQMCGDRTVVESLGVTKESPEQNYKVENNGVILKRQINQEGRVAWMPFSKFGPRRTILNDLSPAATFITYNYNTPVDIAAFELGAKCILKEIKEECGWMYETKHKDGRVGAINYTVWSEVFTCPHCGNEMTFFDVAVDKETYAILKTFKCPGCNAELNKRSLDRVWVSYFDEALQTAHSKVKYTPVLINYQMGKDRYNKIPDTNDLEILRKIQSISVEDWFPIHEMPDGERKKKDGYHLKGITNLHHFYFQRALIVYARLWEKAKRSSNPFALFFVEGAGLTFTKMNRFRATAFSQVNQYMSGTLFVGSLISEVSPAYSMTNKLKRLCKLQLPGKFNQSLITTQSTTRTKAVPDNSVDYVFVDPPFGNNLHYSELNFFWEAWNRVLTCREPEAVMDKGRNRTLPDYQHLMAAAFQEIYRVLKPGHWMTVEFHNSKNSVWNAIQEAMQRAGFVVADVHTLDKQQETYRVQSHFVANVNDSQIVINL